MKNGKNIPMSCERARNVCIVKTLAKLGHFPTRKSEKEAWFLSPLRSETQASFNVSLAKNLWYDFGIGKGGSIIDLIMAIQSCSVKEALEFLLSDTIIPCFDAPKKQANSKKKIEIIKVENLEHLALKSYLRSRNIPVEIARKYCKEVWYRLKDREWFAIGLENNLGGWELRNKYCKNSSSPKSFTYLKRNHKTLLITEGLFDFLSLTVLEEDLVRASDVIVLNSLAFLQNIRTILEKYQEIILFLDNDPAGEKATKEILGLYEYAIDHSGSYKPHKDLNEKLNAIRRNIIVQRTFK